MITGGGEGEGRQQVTKPKGSNQTDARRADSSTVPKSVSFGKKILPVEIHWHVRGTAISDFYGSLDPAIFYEDFEYDSIAGHTGRFKNDSVHIVRFFTTVDRT